MNGRMSDPALRDYSGAASPAEVAAAAGATDLFVLRRVADGRFAHVGGVGRGAGWAGIVEIDADEIAPLDAAVTRSVSDVPEHVFGPYWARWTARVHLSLDLVVVFGGNDFPTDAPDAELVTLARYACDGLAEVTAAKRLADELEVLNAVQDLLREPPETTRDTLDRLAQNATRALSCELGMAYLVEPELAAICDLRPGSELDEPAALAAGAVLARRESFPACRQQASVDDLPTPFSAADGVHSYYLLELVAPARGVLVLAHTNAAPPRGFTSLCQTLGMKLVEAAQPLLAASLLRDSMQDDLTRAEADARRDPLTGLANRLAWNEACTEVSGSGDSPVGIVIVDAGHLKKINETYGYHVGDKLLQDIADVLRGCVRDSDTLARLGGDEFALLLQGSDEEGVSAIADRIRSRVAATQLPDGSPLTVSCGWAIARNEDLGAAQQHADAEMLNEKRSRQSA
jgi:diguanylate cyclase (GGDEF)-like protein